MGNPATNAVARYDAGHTGPLERNRKEILMLRARLFGFVALFLVVALAGCHCPSCSRSASASPTGCASCSAHVLAPIPGPVER
jgi:hypothetical protein